MASTTMYLLVPASTANSQGLAFAKLNAPALDFSFHPHFLEATKAFEKSHLPFLLNRYAPAFDSGDDSRTMYFTTNYPSHAGTSGNHILPLRQDGRHPLET